MVTKSRFDNRGFSIAELMIGGIILVMAIAMGLKVFQTAFKTQTDAQKRLAVSNAVNLISGHLQKNMATGDVKFFGFTGRSPASTPASGDRSLMKVLIPMPGYCANLPTTLGCEQDTSVIYVDYNKTTSPAVTAICGESVLGISYLVVDLEDETFGVPSQVAPGFKVDAGAGGYATGKIPVSANATLATLSAPIATVWQATGAPVKIVATWIASVLKFGGVVAPPGCQEHLQPLGAGYKLNKLYKIPIRPWVLKDVTQKGYANVAATEITSAFGTFPTRVFQAKVRSIGRNPTFPDAASGGSLVMLDCSIAVTGKVTCPAAGTTPLLDIPGITRVEIEMAYALNLYTGGTVTSPDTSLATHFQLKTATFLAPRCVAPDCGTLTWSNSAANPLVVLGANPFDSTAFGESTDKLNGNAFSQLKMEVLKRLQFSIFDKQQKETSFNVLF